MAKRPPPEIIEVELKENEEFISRDDLDFSVEVDEEEYEDDDIDDDYGEDDE